ncbi:MAG: hypothetical protein ABIQ51_01440 [Mesorhizobium sp.]
MTGPTSPSPPGSEFKSFLQAQIYDNKDGGLLSVLSALARLDIDPWQEAAALAKLSKESAVGRLSSLLARLPADPSMPADMGALAARLIPLLPHAANRTASAKKAGPVHATSASPTTPNYIVFSMLLAAVIFGLGIASSRQQPPQSGNAGASTSETNLKQQPHTVVLNR